MAMTWVQSDTTVSTAAACSGLSAGSSMAKAATIGGTAGSSENTLTHATSTAGTLRLVHFRLTVPNGSTWGASTFTIRLNLTTANHQIDWVSAYVCRVNSSLVNQETLGSNTSVGQNMGTAGTITTTVSTSSTTPDADDYVYIVLGFTNAQTMSNQIGITPSLNIDADNFSTPSGGNINIMRGKLCGGILLGGKL